MARQRGFRSVLYVPMLREGVAIGTINVTRREPGAFSDHQVNLLQTFADQAVIAIENVRLFNETKEALEQQTATAEILRVISSSPTDVQPVFDAIAASAARLCGADDVVIRRAEADTTRVVAHVGPVPIAGDGIRPLKRSALVGRAILDSRTLHVLDVSEPGMRKEYPDSLWSRPDREKVRTVLVAPLLREGSGIGAIVMRREEVSAFSEKQIKLLETFAAQAVIAIENVRLFNETKQALEQQTATADILKVISRSPTNTQPVFDAIAQSGVPLFGGQNVSIRLLVGDYLDQVASTLSVDGFRIPRNDEGFPPVRAMLRREAVNVADMLTEDWVNVEAKERARRRGNRAIAFAPMLRGNDPIGVVTVSRATPGLFTDNEIKLLETFASQAVIAIENARLFNETKEALEQQTVISEILRVISSSPTDTQPVFDAIVGSAAPSSVISRYRCRSSTAIMSGAWRARVPLIPSLITRSRSVTMAM
jgi:GAF domain-containing protein